MIMMWHISGVHNGIIFIKIQFFENYLAYNQSVNSFIGQHNFHEFWSTYHNRLLLWSLLLFIISIVIIIIIAVNDNLTCLKWVRSVLGEWKINLE